MLEFFLKRIEGLVWYFVISRMERKILDLDAQQGPAPSMEELYKKALPFTEPTSVPAIPAPEPKRGPGRPPKSTTITTTPEPWIGDGNASDHNR
jgi:hypothetical protein